MGAIRALSGILIVLCVWGCSIQERAAKRVSWVDRKHPITLVRWCADNVPFRGDTALIPGRPIIIPGVIKYVDCDSIPDTDSTSGDSGRKVAVPCPPSTRTVDTFRVTVIDSSAYKIWRHQKDSLRYVIIGNEHDIARAKGSRSSMIWVAVFAGITALILGVVVGFLIRTKSPI